MGRERENFECALGLQRSGKFAEAAAMYRDIIASGHPLTPDACINLGALLHDAGRFKEALAQYRQALALRPGDPRALNNLGNTMIALGRFGEAAESYSLSLRQVPDCTEARLGLGGALQKEGKVTEAIACFKEILEREPENAEAHWNLALALLLNGNYEEGWREYEWRWRKDSFTSPRRGFTAPLWDGSPLAGRTILVHAEQGLGDTLQFARYLPLVAASGGKVLAECQSPSLRPLLERLPGVAAVFVMGERLPPFDLQVPLLSLPRVFGTTIGTVPAPIPYLEPDPARLALWGERVTTSALLKVGVVWAGKPVPDRFRSCSLEALAPLWEMPCVTFYSLQLGEPCAPRSAAELVDLTAEIHDFADTAALVSHLDLVISVDTSVAHLAAALGKPVWLMLPEAADYRWLMERDDSPWYPSLRIFRQKRQGEWGEVVQRVAAELDVAAWGVLEQGAARDPFNGRRHQLCGEYLAARGRHREATARFTKAAKLLPACWEPHYELGASLGELGRLTEARSVFEAGLAVNEEVPALHEALGVIRQLLGDLEGAIISYRKALRLDATLVKARYNLATACRESGRFDDAIREYQETLRIAPEHADAHWNLAITLLMTGDLSAGWREFPWRFRKSAQPPQPRWQERPRWDGAPLNGAAVLLWAEQGLGDTLQFIRYAPLVAARGGRVLVEVQSRSLVPLISRVPGVAAVVAAGEAVPAFDLQGSLLDLPAIFATTLDTIPAGIPYLFVDDAAEHLPHPLSEVGALKVGVVWSGNSSHQNDANRSISRGRLAQLGGVPGVSFYSLQVGGREQTASSGPFSAGGGWAGSGNAGAPEEEGLPDLPMTDLSGCIRDFADTARLARRLDLVITVDTSVAHLCGGLGVPVWVLLPYLPDWRWLLGREDSPWYPTMRLFRQEHPGEWEGVLLRVREALARAASERGRKRVPLREQAEIGKRQGRVGGAAAGMAGEAGWIDTPN